MAEITWVHEGADTSDSRTENRLFDRNVATPQCGRPKNPLQALEDPSPPWVAPGVLA